MTRRKTPADYHTLAEERGFRWIGPEVPNNHTKTVWECAQGHQWEAVYGNIQQGYGCPFCAGAVPKKPTDYHTLAEKHSFRWLGPKGATAHTKTTWECGQGHRWEAPYHGIQQGRGCPVCGVERRAKQRRNKPDDYRALAQERGFLWIGPEVLNNHTKTTWECEQGHQWEATYTSVRNGTSCPVCANRVPKTPVDYHTLAQERGFLWIGPEVRTTRIKTGWECGQGHQWEADYGHILQGRGCPVCAGAVPKTPTDCHALAQERGFRWLGPEVPNIRTKTTGECEQGHRWEAPYHGIQQGSGCPVCAIEEQAEQRRNKPDDYHALAQEQGFLWIGPEVPNNNTKTIWECKEGHQWEAVYSSIQQGSGCPYCAGKAPKTPEDYNALAKERGFRWVGPEVPTTHDDTVWECEQGHQWEAPYGNIGQGSGCPVCAIEEQAERRRNKPDDYHALAQERGFRWIGPEVPNSHTRTTWECEQGHQWEAVYGSIKQGRGCPVCIDMIHGARVSQVQRDLCEMLGGELNRPFGPYRIDVAVEADGIAIAVEYDSWYWHAGREDYDAQRDREMMAAGWRILRVRSNEQLPAREQLDAAIARLLAGEEQVEIVLDDWGIRPAIQST